MQELRINDTKTQNDGPTDTESPLLCLNPLLNPFLLAPPNLETLSHNISQIMSFLNKLIEILYQFLYHFKICSLSEWQQKTMEKLIQDLHRFVKLCRNMQKFSINDTKT